MNTPPDRGLRFREIGLALLAFVVVVSVLFHDVTLGDRTLNAAPHVPFTLPTGPVGVDRPATIPFMDPWGPGWIHEANLPYVRGAIASGSLPFWHPFEACGNPYFAGLLPGVLSPTNLLKLVGPMTVGLDLAYLARLVLAGWLMYLFLRVHKLRPTAAFSGGVLYLGSGYLVGGMNLDVIGEAMIPGLLLAMECLVTRRRPRDLLLATAMVFLVLLSGNPESTSLALALAGVYAMVRTLTLPRTTWVPCAWRYLAAHLIGALLAAPQLLPFLEFVNLASHTHDPHMNVMSVPWPTAIVWVVPGFFRHVYTSRIMAESGGFYGVVTTGWLLAVAGIGLRPHRFLTVFSGVALLAVAGWYFGAPGLRVLNRFPVLNQIQVHKYVAIYLCLLPSILGAVGLDRLLGADLRSIRIRLLGAVAILGALVGAFVWMWDRGSLVQSAGPLRLGPQDPVVPGLGAVWCVLGATILAALLVRFAPRFRTAALLLLVAMLLGETAYHRPYDHAERRPNDLPPSFLSALQGDRRTFRIFSPDRVLYPNTAGMFGLRDIRYAEALKIQRYVRLIQETFQYPAATHYFPTIAYPLSIRAPWTALTRLGVRYVLSLGPLDPVLPEPIRGGERRDLIVGLPPGTAFLRGEIEIAADTPDTPDALTVWQIQPETARMVQSEPVPADGASHPVRLVLDPARPDLLVYFGIRMRAGTTLVVDHVTWGGRRLTPEALCSAAYDPQAITPGSPVRFTRSTVTALPALPAIPPGAAPELTLVARAEGGPATVALTAQQARRLHVVSVPTSSIADPTGRAPFAFELPLDFSGDQRSLPLSLQAAPGATLVKLTRRHRDVVSRGTFDGIEVHEYRQPLPRAYGVHAVEIVPDEAAHLARWLDPMFPASTRVLLEAEPEGITLPAVPPDQPPTVTWLDENPAATRIDLDVTFHADGLLVLLDNHYPGWNAQVDGQPASLLRANYTFRAVPVAAGHHRVTFLFQPTSLWLGWILAAVGLVGLAALLIGSGRASRPAS